MTRDARVLAVTALVCGMTSLVVVASGFSRTDAVRTVVASGFSRTDAVRTVVASGFSRTHPIGRLLRVDPQLVTFTARDGVLVTGSLYVPERWPAPGVVLLHMATRTRQDWDATGQALAQAGIAALAVDFRRGGTGAGSADGTTPGSFADLALDAEAARGYLAARPEVAATRLGMAGASLGANVAAIVASNDPSIRSLVLLSASLDYRGLRIEQPVTRYGDRPALLVASSEDPFALRTARTLVTAGNGPRELRVLSEAGHGTVMLARHPELIDAVVDWFLRTLL
jgi:dienelactone hydrolase